MPSKEPLAIDSRGRKLCGAQNKRGGYCTQPAMPNGRCRIHGGKTPKGVDSPHFQGKGYSKYATFLPEDVRRIYENVAAGAEWASLRGEIDLLQSRMMQLLGSLPEDQPPHKLWKDANAAWNAYNMARQQKNQVEQMRAFNNLHVLLEEGLEQSGVWQEVYALTERLRRLVESERKRVIEQQQSLSPEQGAVLFVAMQDLAKLVAPEHREQAAAVIMRVFPPVPVRAALPAEVEP